MLDAAEAAVRPHLPIEAVAIEAWLVQFVRRGLVGRARGCRSGDDVAPARRAAYEVLRRVFEQDAYADRALAAAAEGLDQRDRALAQRLAYGAVQRARTLDHAIETLGRRPVRKLDPPVLAALRLGAYQLGYVEGVPHYAAVNDSVELVRRARLERAVPFTNAVLRRVGEGIHELVDGLPEGPLKHSYPDWIYELWRDQLGEEDALALMRAQNEPPETVVRLVRGEIEGEPTDVPGRLPCRAGRRARAGGRAHLAAEQGVAARRARGGRARGRADPRLLRRARGARRRCSRARSPPSSSTRAGRASSRRTRGASGRRTCGRERRRDRAAAGADRLRPRARRRAVLRTGRPRASPRPPLARQAAARAPAGAAAGGCRARTAGRDGRLRRVHDQPRRERGGRRRLRAGAGSVARGRVAASTAIRDARNSCSRSRTSITRAASSSRACAHDRGSRAPRLVAQGARRRCVARLAPSAGGGVLRAAGRSSSASRSHRATSP